MSSSTAKGHNPLMKSAAIVISGGCGDRLIRHRASPEAQAGRHARAHAVSALNGRFVRPSDSTQVLLSA